MLVDDALGLPHTVFVAAAARHYLAQLRHGRMATELPDLELLSATREDRFEREPAVALGAELPADVAEAIDHRAAELGVTPARVLEHAALLYLADVDAGKALHPAATGVQALVAPITPRPT